MSIGHYLINRRIPIAIKMSSKRKGPWTFNFTRAHQETHEKLFEKHGELFVCLVCGRDGIAGLSMQEMRTVLDHNFEEQESISVRRRLKTMYQVVGRDGELRGRVSRHAIFEKIEAALAREDVRVLHIHPFPARMAPEVALAGLKGLPPDYVVLDPMSGSGMVVGTAAKLGLEAIGYDLDPLACMISRVNGTKIAEARIREQCSRLVGQMQKIGRKLDHTAVDGWRRGNKEIC